MRDRPRAPETPISLAQLAGKIEQIIDALRREATDAADFVWGREEPALRLCERLLATIRAVLDERPSSLPGAGWRVIVMSLLTKMMSSVRAANTLAAAGHAADVSIVVRSALESLITAMFIMKKDGARRAGRWAQYAVLLRAKFLERYPDLSPKPEHAAAGRKIVAQARRLKRNFPGDGRFWAAGLGRGSVRHLAEDVGMLWHYDFVYWHGSQGTHASAVAVEQYVGLFLQGTASYKMGLSADGLRGEMAVCCELLVLCLGAINELCKLRLELLFEELVREYKTSMSEEPVAEMIDTAKRRRK